MSKKVYGSLAVVVSFLIFSPLASAQLLQGLEIQANEAAEKTRKLAEQLKKRSEEGQKKLEESAKRLEPVIRKELDGLHSDGKALAEQTVRDIEEIALARFRRIQKQADAAGQRTLIDVSCLLKSSTTQKTENVVMSGIYLSPYGASATEVSLAQLTPDDSSYHSMKLQLGIEYFPEYDVVGATVTGADTANLAKEAINTTLKNLGITATCSRKLTLEEVAQDAMKTIDKAVNTVVEPVQLPAEESKKASQAN